MVDFTDSRDLENDTLRDLLKTTMANKPWDGKFETLQKYHDYPICNNWFTKDKVTFDGGTRIERAVQVTESGTAHFTDAYAVESPAVADLQARIAVEWTQLTDNYSISRTEMSRNRGRAKLIDLVKTKRISAMENIANKLEERAWVSPTSSTDKLNPQGIPMWITPIVTSLTYGHVGSLPYYSGGAAATSCGGIVPTVTDPDSSRWKNYADRWAAAASFDGTITEDDITKVARMLRRLRFRTPTFAKDLDNGSYKNLRLYCGEELIEAFENRARANNDSLGADVAKYAGRTLVKGFPLIWAEQLDYSRGTNTTYPFYAINHAYFKPFVMEGDWFRETGPMNDRAQKDVFTTFVDLQFNFVCINRQRGGGIISAVVA